MSTEELDQGQDRAPAGERVQPVWKCSAGGVHVAVWRNAAQRGGSFYSVTFDRRYLRRDGEWASSTSFRLNDIPKAVLVLQKAYDRMVSAREEDEEEEEYPVAADSDDGRKLVFGSFGPTHVWNLPSRSTKAAATSEVVATR